jgi:asparagine synthase (glutamine-hydrolysing)
MCGIVGKVVPQGLALDLSDGEASHAISTISHRGPDACGTYFDGNLWFGHARLSILDLTEAGAQPMATDNGRFVISYNGEVYNFEELAHSLSIHSLRSHSDTEVVLRAFAHLGVDILPRLNGIFAFAIYDKETRKLWLVRDRLGIKPLYYHLNSRELVFGSEIKAITALRKELSVCDLASLHEWLFYGNTLGESTLYQGVKRLLPGHYLELDMETFTHKIVEYWSPRQQAALPPIEESQSDLAAGIRRLLEQAVQRQLVSDVPVGIFLSGGIDSSAITAFASKHYGGKISTYSAGFDFDKGVNELLKARRVAEYYGTEHHEIHISGFEIADIVEKMVHHHDMPFSDAANIPLYLMASQISGQTKVVLQGDGGDELFGGYRRYVALSYYRLFCPLARLGNHINKLTPRTTHHYRRQRYLHALGAEDIATTMALLLTEEDGNSHPAELFTAEIQSEIERYDPFARYRQCQSYFAGQDIINQMALVDSMIILPDIFLEKVDRSTMAASLEVRVPFLDNDLVDYCMRIPGYSKVPGGRKKGLLKKALSGAVPDDILYGPKTGFGVPVGYWLRKALKPLFLDHLARCRREHPDVLNIEYIKRLYAEHEDQTRSRSFLLWKIMNFMIFINNGNIQFN